MTCAAAMRRTRAPRLVNWISLVSVALVVGIAVLAMGLYPRPFTDVMDTSVAELLKHVAQTKLN